VHNTHTRRIARLIVVTLLAAFVFAVPNPLTTITHVSAATPAPRFHTTVTTTRDGMRIRLVNAAGNPSGGALGGTKPLVTSFKVLVNERALAVSAVEYGPGCQTSCYIMELVMVTPIPGGADVTLEYTAPLPDASTTNAAIQSPTGADASSFGPLSVTNNSEATSDSSSGDSSSGDSSSGGTTSGGTTSDGSNAPRWDVEPATESEFDTNTVGYMPLVIPGDIIITNEFGFVIDKNNGIKPKLRSKNYSGKINMSISAKYKDGAKTKNYKCKFAPFGATKKSKAAKWRWHTPKKACVLPTALVTALQNGSATLNAKGKWVRQWSATGTKKRPDKSNIKTRKLKYTVRARPINA
jgi:hypothetical protein